MNKNTTTTTKVSAPETRTCDHKAGYWINKNRNNWRCYECQYQQWTKPTVNQNVERWDP